MNPFLFNSFATIGKIDCENIIPLKYKECILLDPISDKKIISKHIDIYNYRNNIMITVICVIF